MEVSTPVFVIRRPQSIRQSAQNGEFFRSLAENASHLLRLALALGVTSAECPLLVGADISPKRGTSRFDPLRTKAGGKFRTAASH
jgi:hypothetical protein